MTRLLHQCAEPQYSLQNCRQMDFEPESLLIGIRTYQSHSQHFVHHPKQLELALMLLGAAPLKLLLALVLVLVLALVSGAALEDSGHYGVAEALEVSQRQTWIHFHWRDPGNFHCSYLQPYAP